jgi:hypothetical protein
MNAGLNVDSLMTALDNEKNDGIINLTTSKIQETNLNILKELHLNKEILIDYFKKLKGYRYVDELDDLKYGGFIRWIPLTNPDYLPLNQCGIICDIIIADNGVYIVCKNFMHRHYRFKMDECLIFQKLSSQEMIILSALDHLTEDKKKEKKDSDKNEEKDEEKDEEDSDEDDSDNDSNESN